MTELVNPKLEELTPGLHSSFAEAQPFPHFVADNFLAPDFAKALLNGFPAFKEERAIAEHGRVGGKATREDMRNLGEAYRRLDSYFASKGFLDWMSRVTGIPDLLYDPDYFGGGTHENLPGQDMSVHVDFNYHPTRGWHRRVNALLYLNEEWHEQWGGALELWRNPWDGPSRNTIARIAPLWNRLVVFPTTETSWHGFESVKIPEGASVRSRKSIAIYLYTKERPPAETGAMHSTVYYERPLPESIRPERVISRADWNEMTRLTARRDDLLKMIYAREGRFNSTIQELNKKIREQEHALRAMGAPAGAGEAASAADQLGHQLRQKEDILRGFMKIAAQSDTAPVPTSPILFLPSENRLHHVVAGFWRMNLLGPGVSAEVAKGEGRPGHWALIKLRDSDRLQLVFLAQDFGIFFLAHQATSPGSLLVPKAAVYGCVKAVFNQLGEPIALPSRLRTRFHARILAWFFLAVHVGKNILFRKIRSPWLWRLSVTYRASLKALGIHVPVIPPPSL